MLFYLVFSTVVLTGFSQTSVLDSECFKLVGSSSVRVFLFSDNGNVTVTNQETLLKKSCYE